MPTTLQETLQETLEDLFEYPIITKGGLFKKFRELGKFYKIIL